MKKIALTLCIAVFLSACSGGEDSPKTDVFYSPHPDDEVLSLGASIIHSIEDNKEVVVVLLSHGRSSKAIYKVNSKLLAEKLPPISEVEFGNARVTEFKNSVRELGVKESNIHILDLPDGNIEKGKMMDVILDYEKKYEGDVTHHVMSDLDPHQDHAMTGKALRELEKTGKINDGFYYLPVQEHNKMKFDEIVKIETKNNEKYFLKALEAYEKWEPASNSYSIGKISVPEYFEQAKDWKESRYHK
ncbi:PIG-L family deacetylase [Bacillus haimaensis]|uniref:PIG-L deacetylase family protein n=1 Tax=Bacillus haimaensis TaxID=3160967 RepID=UPI003AA99889